MNCRVHSKSMGSRYGKLAFYSWTLALVAGVWVVRRLAMSELPSAWVLALCIGACLFVFHFGVRAPRVGLISMERVPQMGLLLALSPPAAAAICAIGSLLWPLLSRRYNQGSFTVGILRGIHNAGMTALMLMCGGYAYIAAGGHHPLREVAPGDLAPLLLMAVTIQVVNIALMTLFFRLDGREVRQIITPSYALSDLIFVPAGVLAAVLFNARAPTTFALFAALMIVFVLSFHLLDDYLGDTNSERGPIAKLFRTSLALRGARTIDALGARIVSEVRMLVRLDEFYLALIDRDRQELAIRIHEVRGARMLPHAEPLGAGLFGRVIERKEPLVIRDWRRAPQTLRELGEITGSDPQSLIIVPLLESGAAIGVLCVQHASVHAYSDADLHLMQRLAEEVAVAVVDAQAFEDAENYRRHLEQRVTERTEELERANRDKERLIAVLRERSQTLERESREDALTGVASRRYFMQRLAAEMEVASAAGHPLTLAIADLDHFKVINDRLGHPLGDQVLQHSSALLKNLCRSTDVLGRIGGEEFALVLAGTECDTAIDLCERMRDAVESHAWSTVHPELRVTISIGLWQWDGKSTISDLLRAADSQLYEAKRGGRNRVARAAGGSSRVGRPG
jgi:diguanylate cyclase (GGDEF)-like protein